MSRLECIVTIVELHRLRYGGGAVTQWVTALEWRPGGPGFESRGGNLTSESELWQFRLPRFASVFRRRH